MPRVTEAYRAARREQIADAAIRVLTRKGVARTSIADIIAESGLSAGSIYSNFRDKGELGQFVARSVLGTRVDEVLAQSGQGPEPLTPRQLLELLLTSVYDRKPPFPVVLQFWAESTVDAELSSAVHEILGELESRSRAAIMPWARAQPEAKTEADAAHIAAVAATAMITVAQSYVMRSALSGELDPRDFLDGLATALG